MVYGNNKIKEALKDFYLYYESPKIINPELPSYVKSILFVCKGNICRSPFAEYIANKIALERSFKKLVSRSAGLLVPTSLSSPHEVLEAAEKFGVHLNAHKSNGITSKMAESSDMIIAMEAWQIIRIRELFPMFREKTFLLPLFKKNRNSWKWSYNIYNISDPYGKPLQYFIDCFKRIEGCVYDLFVIIK